MIIVQVFLGKLSNYLEDELLDHILGTGAYVMPTIYVALHTADPGEAGAGAEVAGGAYARQTMAFNIAAAGQAANSAQVNYPDATANWGIVSHWALWDQLNAGNMLLYGRMINRVTLGNNTTQFDITNPEGIIMRYTYDGTGLDPVIGVAQPAPGELMEINIANASVANNGTFVVTMSGANWFEVVNPDGVPEVNVTIGGGSLVQCDVITKAVDNGDSAKFNAGEFVVTSE